MKEDGLESNTTFIAMEDESGRSSFAQKLNDLGNMNTLQNIEWPWIQPDSQITFEWTVFF